MPWRLTWAIQLRPPKNSRKEEVGIDIVVVGSVHVVVKKSEAEGNKLLVSDIASWSVIRVEEAATVVGSLKRARVCNQLRRVSLVLP